MNGMRQKELVEEWGRWASWWVEVRMGKWRGAPNSGLPLIKGSGP